MGAVTAFSRCGATRAALNQEVTTSRSPLAPTLAPVLSAGSNAAWRQGATMAAVRDWVATQALVIEYWRDLLTDTHTEAGAGASKDTEALFEALDAHAAFLRSVGEDG